MTSAVAIETIVEEAPLRVVQPEQLHVAAEYPEILVFGKPGCGKCDAFKEKLEKHLKLPYQFIDWSTQDVTQFDWRNTRAVDFMADCAIKDIDLTHPPVIAIAGKAYDYVGAIKELMSRRK